MKQMLETERIADQLRRFYEGTSWLGPSLRELVSDVPPERAANGPAAGTHTIWELVLHITAWLRIARERLSAASVFDPTNEENWPAIHGSWAQALEQLETEVSALENAIRSFPPERLNDPAPAAEPQTFYILLHGVIQHSAYHAGQIAILKK